MENVDLNADADVNIDVNYFIDAIEVLRQAEKRQLIYNLSSLMRNIISWDYVENSRWPVLKTEIKKQRFLFNVYYSDNIVLNQDLDKIIQDAYRIACYELLEYKFSLPSECPYTFEQLMDDKFFPESDNE